MELETLARLKEDILQADQLKQLRSIRDQFQQSLLVNGQYLRMDWIEQWNAHINEFHDAIISRTIALTELRMVGEGHGPPPASYCYLLLGSAGRSEQTLASDQDSALIFDKGINVNQSKLYFKTFASYIVSSLTQLGYPPCDGNVQSNEELWCQTVDEWRNKLDTWYEDASWKSIRYLLIVADARSIAGNVDLHHSVKAYFKKQLQARPQILERMIENTVQHKMLTGFFGQWITDRYGDTAGSIDIKYGAYIPFVNSVRWLSLYADNDQTATLKRLEGLKEQKILTGSQFVAYHDAFLQMLSLRLMAGYHMEDDKYISASKLQPKRLEPSEVKRLKKSLRLGKELQRLVIQSFARRD